MSEREKITIVIISELLKELKPILERRYGTSVGHGIEYGRNLILKPDSGSNKNFKELAVIDIKDIVSTISKFKITVNGEIGYKNLPVYTLVGIVNTDLLNIDCLTNAKSFGIRTVGNRYESNTYGSFIVPKRILCWNIII